MRVEKGGEDREGGGGSRRRGEKEGWERGVEAGAARVKNGQ